MGHPVTPPLVLLFFWNTNIRVKGVVTAGDYDHLRNGNLSRIHRLAHL